MGETIIEKLIGRHCGKSVRPGDVVWMDLDVRSARDFGGANVVENYRREYGVDPIPSVESVFFTFDCVVPANNKAYANNQQICRVFARERDIALFDVDAGIGSHVLVEKGKVVPGCTLVGTDSHLNIVGAIGAFGQGMGDVDIAYAFRSGRTWFEVPPSMKVTVTGRYEFPTTAKDVVLALVGKLGSSGALGMAMEITGDAVEGMTVTERITIASMATEMGAIAAFFVPNQEVISYCQDRSGSGAIEVVEADPDADYECEVVLDVQDLPPLIAVPHSPANVRPVSEVAPERVDSVFFGSCTNGRLDDFAAAARILSTHPVASHVMAKAVPATREVFGELMTGGVLGDLFESGVIISNPGCGGCASGQIGMTGAGEVQVSTSNRNFKGKQGAGRTYLASPVTAAACAAAGTIMSPREVLK